MNRASTAVAAAVLLLLASASPTIAAESGRASGGDQGSAPDACDRLTQEYQQLRDKQADGTATPEDLNRMRDLERQLQSMCNNWGGRSGDGH